MINFFQKTRKKLADENRFLQYSRYAIGEIVLVMVGILLALQVNNWNEQRKEIKQVITSLESLQEDLIIQNEIIDAQILFELDGLAMIDSIFMNLENPKEIYQVDRMMDSLTGRLTFISVKATFNNFEGSGGLMILDDLELKNAIVRYYQKLDYVASVVNNNNLFIIDNQYSQYFLSNPLHFSINKEGVLNKPVELINRERYELHKNLNRRKVASTSILTISHELKYLTDELIAKVDRGLINYGN